MKAVLALGVEFLLSVFVFLTIITFVVVMTGKEIIVLQDKSISESFKTRSYRLSELLLFDEGFPKDWDSRETGEIARFGLSSGEDYVLDMNKITKLNEVCASNYEIVRDSFGEYVVIGITYLDGERILNCDSGIRGVVSAITERLATVNNKIIKLNVTVIG